jgi:hypothetical protein
MAHELGHGIFGLDHIFSGAYGIKKGATYNLMDYTEKTPNDALSYHEWTQINLPLPSWSALSRVEEDMYLSMSKVMFTDTFSGIINTLFGDYPELQRLFVGRYTPSWTGRDRYLYAPMNFANTIQNINPVNENDSEELFSVALIAGIIYSGVLESKNSITLTKGDRTVTNNSGRTINLGNPQNDRLYGIRVSYISLNPNSTSVSIDGNDIIEFTDEDYRFSFVHEIVHSKLWVEQSNVQLTPMQLLSIQAGTTTPPSSTENLIQNMINVKYNFDCAIQIDNFIRMYMHRKQNNTTDVSDCIVRTTRGHHNWPEDINESIDGYHLTLPQLIDLPENIFSRLISDEVFEALKGVNGNGKKITVHRNMIPEKYRTSYYGYR